MENHPLENHPFMPSEPPGEAGPLPPPQKSTAWTRRPRVFWLSGLLAALLLFGTLLGFGLANKGPLASLHYLGFKQFSNGDFSIWYPSNWKADSHGDNSVEEFSESQDRGLLVGNFGQVNADFSTDPVALAPDLCTFAAFQDIKPVSAALITIGGQRWAQADCGSNGQYHSMVDGVIYKGNLYSIIYSSSEATFASDRSRFFSRMEQSFQFLK